MIRGTERRARDRLDDESCRRLLGIAALGRVLLSVDCMPAAVPVRIALAMGHVIVAPAPAPVRDAAVLGHVVTVEVDGEEPDGATWAVLVTGVARIVAQDDPLRSTGAAPQGLADPATAMVAVPCTHLVGERYASQPPA